uniref:Uncharacterized protein n=1 Tax=Tanacetum cinerariifolium TaxID=118510 RepID=A0A6L2MNY8_TANCI|nr:hypothetical protein [Tanacetum cinerariifolium]
MAPPLWWRSDDGTPPQSHLVASGCDGATPCGICLLAWMGRSVDIEGRGLAVVSSASSAVTYTSVYTDSEPGRVFWGADEELPDEESDLKEDPEKYEDDESEDGPIDYPIDGGDDVDDDDGDSSGDDDDNEDEDEEDEEDEEKEEHLAPADSAIVIPTVKLVYPPEGIEPVIPPPSTDTTTTRAKIIALIDAVTATLPSPPLPPPLYIPPPVDHRDDIPESKILPRKRSCLFALGSKYEIGESSTARLTGDPADEVPEIAPMTLGEVNTWVTELGEPHEHDTRDLYARLEDAQDSRTRKSQRVTMDTQQVDLHMEDRIAHQETILIMKKEAYATRESWAYLIGLSQAVYSKL